MGLAPTILCPLSRDEEKYETIVKPATCSAWTDLDGDTFLTANANAHKNRHWNIRPYESTRVKITGESDYINANWVGGGSYIATQAPLPGTVNDFWRMVWECECFTIVILTGIGPNQADLYWPQDAMSPMSVGSLILALEAVHDEQYSKYRAEETAHGITVRHLTLSDGHTMRNLVHLQFEAWPDHGVPKKEDLESFLEVVARHDGHPRRPRVVHCSAGVGRTGTYIAVDMARTNLREGRKADITNTVISLRKERLRMVDQPAQYALAKACVRDYKIAALNDSGCLLPRPTAHGTCT